MDHKEIRLGGCVLHYSRNILWAVVRMVMNFQVL